MKKNLIDKYLTPESRAKADKIIDEQIKFYDELLKNGYEYNTDKSYSLKLIRDNGFNPIGITTMMCEETFIFETTQESEKAYKKCEQELGDVSGWWYGKKEFLEYKKEYEQEIGHEIKVYWL